MQEKIYKTGFFKIFMFILFFCSIIPIGVYAQENRNTSIQSYLTMDEAQIEQQENGKIWFDFLLVNNTDNIISDIRYAVKIEGPLKQEIEEISEEKELSQKEELVRKSMDNNIVLT